MEPRDKLGVFSGRGFAWAAEIPCWFPFGDAAKKPLDRPVTHHAFPGCYGGQWYVGYAGDDVVVAGKGNLSRDVDACVFQPHHAAHSELVVVDEDSCGAVADGLQEQFGCVLGARSAFIDDSQGCQAQRLYSGQVSLPYLRGVGAGDHDTDEFAVAQFGKMPYCEGGSRGVGGADGVQD